MNLWGRVPTPVGEDPLPALIFGSPTVDRAASGATAEDTSSKPRRPPWAREAVGDLTKAAAQCTTKDSYSLTFCRVAARMFASRVDIAPGSLGRYRETDWRADCLGGYSFKTESAVIHLLLGALHHLTDAGHQQLT